MQTEKTAESTATVYTAKRLSLPVKVIIGAVGLMIVGLLTNARLELASPPFRAAMSKAALSPRFRAQLEEQHITLDMTLRHHPLALKFLQLFPDDEHCPEGMSEIQTSKCWVAGQLPFPVEAASAYFTKAGQKKIGLNLYAPWEQFFRPGLTINMSVTPLMAWTMWHELGHFHQINGKEAVDILFDKVKSKNAALHRETHSDIFAILNLAREPDFQEADIKHLIVAVEAIRDVRSKEDPNHATGALLRCLKPAEYQTPESADTAALKLLKLALERSSVSPCSNAKS